MIPGSWEHPRRYKHYANAPQFYVYTSNANFVSLCYTNRWHSLLLHALFFSPLLVKGIRIELRILFLHAKTTAQVKHSVNDDEKDIPTEVLIGFPQTLTLSAKSWMVRLIHEHHPNSLNNTYNTGWFKKTNSISYVYISWTIHGMWMIYITFRRGDPEFSNTAARALA